MTTASPTMGYEKIPGDRYEVVGRLGSGAFGSVCKAIDTFLNRPVAIKSIRLDTSVDPEHRKALNRRFIREAQVAAQLHHPNIVTIYDIMFTSETGFLVMEYIEGVTLQELLEKSGLPLAQAIDVATQVARAIQYAHEHKVVHRDIKPGNIMITASGGARITDFGIAKSDGATHMTMSGGLVGTPDYMSPEQARGEEVDARSDIFSLGCVLYECAVGEKPFKGTTLTAVLLGVVNSDPLQSEACKRRKLPPALGDVLARALAKEPEARFATAAELAGALSEIRVDDDAPPALPPPPVKPRDSEATLATNEEPPRSVSEADVERLKREERPLVLAPSLADELENAGLTPAQGFILSRIDGSSKARDILSLSPVPELEAAATLLQLIDRGLLTWEGGSPGDRPLAPNVAREVDRLLALGRKRRYSELLGVNVSSSTADIKRSYLDLIQRYHPDAQGAGLEPGARKRLSDVCALATKAVTALSARHPKSSPGAAIRGARPDFDRSKQAREIFKRAQRAFDETDYWQAIQLARQAVELDGTQASYHHLLGLGLMKNHNWLKEAEECLTKAVELDPDQPEYYELLAAVYKSEGMPERSASMLEKAKSLDSTASAS